MCYNEVVCKVCVCLFAGEEAVRTAAAGGGSGGAGRAVRRPGRQCRAARGDGEQCSPRLPRTRRQSSEHPARALPTSSHKHARDLLLRRSSRQPL